MARQRYQEWRPIGFPGVIRFAGNRAAGAAGSFSQPSFPALASAGAYLFISVCFDFHTGDLTPFRTVPMLGSQKAHHPNPGGFLFAMISRNCNLNPVSKASPRS